MSSFLAWDFSAKLSLCCVVVIPTFLQLLRKLNFLWGGIVLRIIPWLGLQVLSPYCCRLKAIKEPISKNLVPSVVFTCYSVPLIHIIIIFSIPKVRSGPTCQRRQDGKGYYNAIWACIYLDEYDGHKEEERLL